MPWLILLSLGFLLYKTDTVTETVLDLEDTLSQNLGVDLNDWTKYDEIFKYYGAVNGVDWQWLKAFALNESNLGRAASVAHGLEFPLDVEGSKSSDGKSWGLMQMTLPTARELDPGATAIELNNPDYSVNLASEYISKLKSMYNPQDARYAEWVVKSYNQGPGNTRKEIAGLISGYADEYWARWQRNLAKVAG